MQATSVAGVSTPIIPHTRKEGHLEFASAIYSISKRKVWQKLIVPSLNTENEVVT